ncbi:MAG TPA: hypothetical protein VFE59_41980, partial [Trebonia sp.]|nr:hypothetical protein [Trebonia sp.]
MADEDVRCPSGCALARVRRASGAPSDVCCKASRYLIHHLSQFKVLESSTPVLRQGSPSTW